MAGARPGFTLLEATVAMAIVSLVAIGAMAALSGSIRASTRAESYLPAPELAQERLAALELIDPARLEMLPDSLSHGRFPAPYQDYAWDATAKRVDGEPALVQISVDVHWYDGAYTLAERRYTAPTTLSLTTRP